MEATEGLLPSGREFVHRVGHRWYILLPGALGGTVWVGQIAGLDLKLPPWVPLAAIGVSFLLATFWAFHDLRVERDRSLATSGSDPRFPALSDLLGRSLTIGVGLSDQRDSPPLEAWKLHTERLVASAYGEGEAALVFTPELKASQNNRIRSITVAMLERPPLLMEQINGLKALLGRMPTLTIRPDFDPADWSAFDLEGYRATHARPLQEAPDGTWTCPWCRRDEDALASTCEGCGAEISGDLVYAGSP